MRLQSRSASPVPPSRGAGRAWLIRSVVVLAVIIGGVATVAWFVPPAQGQTWAAWVQAAGSIVALYVAYLVGASQSAAAYEVGRQQSQAALEAVLESQRAVTLARVSNHLAVAEMALLHAREIGTALDDDEDPVFALLHVYDARVTQRVSRALTAIPAHEVGNADAVKALLSMGDQFVLLERQVELFLRPATKRPHMQQAFDKAERTWFLGPREDPIAQSDAVLVINAKNHLRRIELDFEAVEMGLQAVRAMMGDENASLADRDIAPGSAGT